MKIKYIDADKLKAEIKRRHDYENEMYHKTKPDGRPNEGWAESLAIMGELEELLTFLDTLEEESDKSLEETAAAFVWDIMEKDYYRPSELSKRLRPTSKLDDFYGALAEIFIAGAKWQEGQLLKGSPLPEDTVLFQKGVEEGRRLEREDIMKDAVEGEVHKYDKFSYVKEKNSKSLTESLAKFNNNDKVKIIIVKEK